MVVPQNGRLRENPYLQIRMTPMSGNHYILTIATINPHVLTASRTKEALVAPSPSLDDFGVLLEALGVDQAAHLRSGPWEDRKIMGMSCESIGSVHPFVIHKNYVM